MRILIICLILISVSNHVSYSQANFEEFDWVKVRPDHTFENFDWSVLPNGFTEEMIESLVSNPHVVGQDHLTLFKIKNELIATLPCKNDILKWTGNAWENLYNGYAAGFNCQSFFFVKDDTLYSHGRYGYWHAHSELIYFDFNTGYWDNLPAKNLPVHYSGVGVYQTQDYLISIFGEYIQQSLSRHEPEKDGFYFSFEKKSWFPLKINYPDGREETNWLYNSFDLKDVGFKVHRHLSEWGILIFNKKNLNLNFTKTDIRKIDNFSIAIANGNQVTLFDKFGDAVQLDLNQDKIENFEKVGQIELLDSWDGRLNAPILSWTNSLFISLFLLISGIAIFYFSKYRKLKLTCKTLEMLSSESESGKREETNEQEIFAAIDLLIPYAGKSIELDEFDRILGIDAIDNFDYRRVRRSRLVKLINQTYLAKNNKELLEREKSTVDKRIMLYRIVE